MADEAVCKNCVNLIKGLSRLSRDYDTLRDEVERIEKLEKALKTIENAEPAWSICWAVEIARAALEE